MKALTSILKSIESSISTSIFEDFETPCPVCQHPINGHRQKDKDGHLINEWVDECHVCLINKKRQETKKKIAKQQEQEHSSIPALLRDARFDIADSRIQKQAHIVKAYAKSILEKKDTPVKTIMLQGGYGLGKSWLAVACVNYIRSAGGTASMVDAVDLALTVRSAWTKKQSPEEVYEAYMAPDLLVIDEIGTPESLRDNLSSVWERVIQKRFDSALPLILITNLSYEEMLRSVDHRIIDRIFSDKYAYRLAFEGKSLRHNDRKPHGTSH